MRRREGLAVVRASGVARRPRRALACAAVALLSAWPRQGSAQMVQAVDASGVLSTAEKPGSAGVGVDTRFGYRGGFRDSWFDNVLIGQAEVIGGYRRIPGAAGMVDVGRFGLGGRLGLLFGEVEPFLFAHFSAAAGSGGWGYLFDVGGALDWRLPFASLSGEVGWVSLGVHVNYNRLALADEQWKLVEIGPHVELREFWW